MTLPLQPMTTAPRDGREVLIVLNAGEKHIAEWVGDNPDCVIRNLWTNGCESWADEAIKGWLDIAAMVRDSERYRFIRDNAIDYELRNSALPRSKRQQWAFKRRFTNYPYDVFETVDEAVDATRAAIDKEIAVDNQQAAETLRKEARELSTRIGYGVEVSAHEHGADAIEMLAWLFTPGRWDSLYGGYSHSDVPGDFRSYCERQWREHGRE